MTNQPTMTDHTQNTGKKPEELVPTSTLIKCLYALSRDIQSDDGVANSALIQVANRLEFLQKENDELKRSYVKQDYF